MGKFLCLLVLAILLVGTIGCSGDATPTATSPSPAPTLTAGPAATATAASTSTPVAAATPAAAATEAAPTNTPAQASTPASPPTPEAPPLPPSAPVQTESGLVYIDVEVGTGPVAQPGTRVTVHYTGMLTIDNSVFDSSVERGEPFQFDLGAGNVIQGWDEGVAGMKVGGRRHLIIPADLAYGERGFGDLIPPNSWLTFDVELLDVSR